MTDSQRVVLRTLNSHAFTSPTCHPSQDLLARETGYTREHVNRCIRALANAGHITVDKRRRPGCKWQHNVYTLAHWSPPLRSGRLNVLREIRRQNTSDHTERTATPRGRHPRGVPTSLGAVVGSTSAVVRASAAQNARIDPRRSAVDPHPTREPAKVVHICKGCEALSRQVEQMTEALQREREERDIAERQRIRAGRAEQAARNELRAALEADPTAETIHEVIDYWKTACGHPRAKNRLDDERGKAVRKALKHYSQGELHEMIDGLAIAPYTMFGRRKLTGTDDSRRDELEFILRRDDEVRKLIEIARRARGATADAAWLAWQRVSAQEWAAFLTLRDKVVGDRHHGGERGTA